MEKEINKQTPGRRPHSVLLWLTFTAYSSRGEDDEPGQAAEH